MKDEDANKHARSILMLAGSALLFLSMLGASKILWGILSGGGPSIGLDEVMKARLLWLGILFATGWTISLFNIRVLHCLAQPVVIQFFLCFTLLGILAIYGRIIFRFYIEDPRPIDHLRYILAFSAGFAALISLHLLVEGHNLRPCGMPIAVLVFIHILLGGMHYVFRDNAQSHFAWADAGWLLAMGLMFFLITRHFGLLNPLRYLLNGLFPADEQD